MPTPVFLTNLLPEEVSSELGLSQSFRGKQIFKWVGSGVSDFDKMTNLSLDLRNELKSKAILRCTKVTNVLKDPDGTIKLQITTSEQNAVETVLLTDKEGRKTACVSCQVGCAMKCAFCQTGTLGLARNLIPAEIVEQFLYLEEIAGKLDKKDYYTYVILGDGELEEGQIWEAAMTASHYKLNNLVVIVDNNNLQIDGKITEVKSPEPIADKFNAFGFNVVEINGHNFDEIQDALNKAKLSQDKPTAVIAHTKKGKGISFMEDQVGWHGKAPNDEEYENAIIELSK